MERSHIKHPTNVVLVSAGSFSPPTLLHLRLFELARDWIRENRTDVAVCKGIMTPVSDAYGKSSLVDAPLRVEMTRLATFDSDWIEVDSWESEQDTYQTTVTVLEYIQNKYSMKPILLCGADLLESFAEPGVWSDTDIERIVKEFGVAAIRRDKCNAGQLIENMSILRKNKNNIWLIDNWIKNNISSTKIRQALSVGRSVKYLIPSPVIEFIYSNNLYGSKRITNTISLE